MPNRGLWGDVRFDGTINLGHVITIGVALAGGVFAYAQVSADIQNHADKITSIERQISELPDLKTIILNGRDRLEALEKAFEKSESSRSTFERRLNDRLDRIAEDTATIKGRLEVFIPGPTGQ